MEWLARYFARAVVRRIAYVIVALLFAALGIGNARADCFNDLSDDGSVVMCGDQGEAASGGYSAASKIKAQGTGGVGSNNIRIEGPVEVNMSSRTLVYRVIWASQNQLLARVARGWPQAKSCSDRNANALADAGLSYTEASSCIGGCSVQGTRFSQASGVVKVYGMKDRTYNGEVCVAAKPSNDIGEVSQEKEDATKPKPPECMALEKGQTACQKTNGDYCATASTGKTFCWTPGESGKKTDGPEAQVRSPKGDPVTPPSVNISDQEWQRKEGHQQTACINSNCATYNVTNFSSVPTGTAKNSTGDNTEDGSGNTSGNGSQSGDGKGDDDKSEDSATDSGNCTVAPMCVGDTLKCLHLKFTWKTQCNTERGEVSAGNTCADGDIPVCTGKSCKAAEYSQVLQSWRTRCGIEKDRDAAKAESDRGAADAAGDDEAGAVAKLWDKDGKPGPQLDQNRLSIGGGDLLGANIEIMGTAFTLNSQFYDAIAIIKKIIIASAMVAALWILWRS
ncbi:coat protein [Xanthomonas arboricola]|uniref:coat protein n=1 Tax=Xanthomonas arboricola TaxID=56448 RepID=UPI00063EC5A9|nr:coat protein [Xanthomonas arboricola]PPT19898.1 A coat protein [Xanthomonas arboricola]